MAVVSAGSLCAGASELPTGVSRQYNVLEIADDFTSVRVHVRAMTVANLFSRGHLMDFGGASFAILDWEPSRNPFGSVLNTNVLRARATIEEAELAAKSGDPTRAVKLLHGLDTPPGSYERQLLLTAATGAKDWKLIVRITDPPTTIEELIQRVEAYNWLGDSPGATATLDRFSKQLQLPEPLAADLRQRIKAQEAIRR